MQYNELGRIPDSEVPGSSGNPAYTAALVKLDSDIAQYIHDNTDDEFTYQSFLNKYHESKGAEPVNLVALCTVAQRLDRAEKRRIWRKMWIKLAAVLIRPHVGAGVLACPAANF